MLYTTVVDIKEVIHPQQWNNLLTYIDKERREKLNNLHFPMDKKRSLVGGVLIKNMLLEHFSIDASKLSFCRTFFGKPYLREYDGIYYNLSHSGDFVCCSVSDTEVGIDIEEINKSVDLNDFEPFFSTSEWRQVTNDSKNKHDTFFSLWTLKESYVKKIGVGLSKDFTSFSLKFKDPIELVDSEKASHQEQFLLNTVDQKYKLAICSEQCQNNQQKEIVLSELFPVY